MRGNQATTLALILLIAFSLPAGAETVRSKIKQGVNSYKNGKYDEALKNFVGAQIESPENAGLSYNLGNTYYKMKDYDQAVKNYLNSAAKTKEIPLEEKSYYNLGNCYYRQGKLEEAVAYYQKALELDFNDMDAKKNLEFVREEIKRRLKQEHQQQQQQQSQSGGQKQDKGQGEQNKQEQQKQADKQEKAEEKKAAGQGQDKDDQKGKDKDNKAQSPGSAYSAREMSDEEAQRWLDSLNEDRREFLKQQMQAQPGQGSSAGKDW